MKVKAGVQAMLLRAGKGRRWPVMPRSWERHEPFSLTGLTRNCPWRHLRLGSSPPEVPDKAFWLVEALTAAAPREDRGREAGLGSGRRGQTHCGLAVTPVGVFHASASPPTATRCRLRVPEEGSQGRAGEKMRWPGGAGQENGGREPAEATPLRKSELTVTMKETLQSSHQS